MIKPKVILIAGPTGVGKTASSVHLAKKLDTEIISCDSMQIYKGMDIGTAKVTCEETLGVCHHMIDIADPKESFSVADYVSRATPIIHKLNEEGRIPLMVGGTGLYADSVIKGTTFEEDASADLKYREEMMEFAKKEGPEFVHRLLVEVDPESGENIHPNNVKRVVRALEYYHATNEKISAHNEMTKKQESPFESVRIYFTRDKEILYSRINERVDIMVKNGLFEEVKNLLEKGVGRETTAMQALGYKEVADAIRGKITFEEAVELIKRDSRRYAKRQLTWFKRDTGGIWLNLDEFSSSEEIAGRCYEIIKERNML